LLPELFKQLVNINPIPDTEVELCIGWYHRWILFTKTMLEVRKQCNFNPKDNIFVRFVDSTYEMYNKHFEIVMQSVRDKDHNIKQKTWDELMEEFKMTEERVPLAGLGYQAPTVEEVEDHFYDGAFDDAQILPDRIPNPKVGVFDSELRMKLEIAKLNNETAKIKQKTTEMYKDNIKPKIEQASEKIDNAKDFAKKEIKEFSDMFERPKSLDEGLEYILDEDISYPKLIWHYVKWFANVGYEFLKLNYQAILLILAFIMYIICNLLPEPKTKKYKNAIVYGSKADKALEIFKMFELGREWPFKYNAGDDNVTKSFVHKVSMINFLGFKWENEHPLSRFLKWVLVVDWVLVVIRLIRSFIYNAYQIMISPEDKKQFEGVQFDVNTTSQEMYDFKEPTKDVIEELKSLLKKEGKKEEVKEGLFTTTVIKPDQKIKKIKVDDLPWWAEIFIGPQTKISLEGPAAEGTIKNFNKLFDQMIKEGKKGKTKHGRGARHSKRGSGKKHKYWIEYDKFDDNTWFAFIDENGDRVAVHKSEMHGLSHMDPHAVVVIMRDKNGNVVSTKSLASYARDEEPRSDSEDDRSDFGSDYDDYQSDNEDTMGQRPWREGPKHPLINVPKRKLVDVLYPTGISETQYNNMTKRTLIEAIDKGGVKYAVQNNGYVQFESLTAIKPVPLRKRKTVQVKQKPEGQSKNKGKDEKYRNKRYQTHKGAQLKPEGNNNATSESEKSGKEDKPVPVAPVQEKKDEAPKKESLQQNSGMLMTEAIKTCTGSLRNHRNEHQSNVFYHRGKAYVNKHTWLEMKKDPEAYIEFPDYYVWVEGNEPEDDIGNPYWQALEFKINHPGNEVCAMDTDRTDMLMFDMSWVPAPRHPQYGKVPQVQLDQPTQNTRVTFMGYIHKDGKPQYHQSNGVVQTIDIKNKDFEHSCSTVPSACGGVLVDSVTGRVVGFHYMGTGEGVQRRPNRAMTFPLN